MFSVSKILTKKWRTQWIRYIIQIMITVYCYDKCTTCKKSLAWLDEHGFTYKKIDIKGNRPSEELLRSLHAKSGLPLKRFFNTSGLLYKELELSKRLPEINENEQFSLLASDGMLIKRPLLFTENKAWPGFKEEEWERILADEK